jgi:hypothetical protein
MKKYVYHYCILYTEYNTQTYKNGFFECKNISSTKQALEILDEMENELNLKDFVLISFNKIGEVKDEIKI